VIALLRQVTEAQRGGVNRSSQLRHLAEWLYAAPDEPAAHALASAAFNLRSARHLGGAHDDAEQISSRATWQDAPGVDISVTLFRRGKAPTAGVPQPARSNPAIKAALRQRQAEERAAERAAAHALLERGAHDRVLDDSETRVLLRLLTLATEARTIVAGRLRTATGGNDVLAMRLVPSDQGSTVRTRQGTLHLPGFRLELTPARPLTPALDTTFVSGKRGAQREAAAQRAARALIEYPVVYYAQVEPEIADALRQSGVAENLARLTGLAVERRAEGVLLADASGRFTDRPFPGRGGAVNRAAGLLLAKSRCHRGSPRGAADAGTGRRGGRPAGLARPHRLGAAAGRSGHGTCLVRAR
jgi:hypothetical protein